MKAVRENGVEMMCPENNTELREIEEGFEIIKIKTAMMTQLTLKDLPQEIVEKVKDAGYKLADINQGDIEFRDCQKSLRHLLYKIRNEDKWSDEVAQIIYFLFEFMLISTIIDNIPIVKLTFDSGHLFMLGVGLSIIAAGIADGTEQVLEKKE